jgi:hypothetical protein
MLPLIVPFLYAFKWFNTFILFIFLVLIQQKHPAITNNVMGIIPQETIGQRKK